MEILLIWNGGVCCEVIGDCPKVTQAVKDVWPGLRLQHGYVFLPYYNYLNDADLMRTWTKSHLALTYGMDYSYFLLFNWTIWESAAVYLTVMLFPAISVIITSFMLLSKQAQQVCFNKRFVISYTTDLWCWFLQTTWRSRPAQPAWLSSGDCWSLLWRHETSPGSPQTLLGCSSPVFSCVPS